MATKVLGNRYGDLLLWFMREEINFTSAKLKNPETYNDVNLANVVGQPVKLVSTDWVLMKATDETSARGLVVSGEAIGDLPAGESTDAKYLILTDGPAVVNEDKVATEDYEGTALTLADIKTGLANFTTDLTYVTEPTKTTTGTT